ncbi:MAG: hypothetical protein HXY45_00665 [Syntrophaceae bacterium]|nr:hypothetical protein [Syntrophaceae bacterium]
MRRLWVFMFLFLWLMSVFFINHLHWNARASWEKALRRPFSLSRVETPREAFLIFSWQKERFQASLRLSHGENMEKEARG